jgi:large subunit ribosomal protein L29
MMSKEAIKLRELSLEELEDRIDDAREELMKLRFQQSTGELTDFSRLRHTRRQIARMMTVLSERQRAAMMEGEV